MFKEVLLVITRIRKKPISLTGKMIKQVALITYCGILIKNKKKIIDICKFINVIIILKINIQEIAFCINPTVWIWNRDILKIQKRLLVDKKVLGGR